MEQTYWKVGELAKLAGLTVRTLHHYDQIGLFSPASVSDSGHRLYHPADLLKLHQILSLKQLGFSLEEIKAMVQSPNYEPKLLLKQHLSRVDEQIEHLENLRSQLQDIHEMLDSGKTATSDQFINLMQMMKMVRSPHFKHEHREGWKARYRDLGSEELDNRNAKGQQLIDEFRKRLQEERPPDDPAVASLAKHWKHELAAFVPQDDAFTRSVERYYGENPHEALQYGLDYELYMYIKQAVSLL